VIGYRIGYTSATPHLFTGTLRHNLLMGLRHRPVRPAEYSETEARRRARQAEEARRSGKPSILHLKVDPEAITPSTTIAKLRENALAEQSGP